MLILLGGRSNSENNKLITLRFVTGAWCLVSLVLVTAYSSTLTSFIMAPNYKPLVNSIQELAEKVDTIEPIVLKGFGMDVTLSVYLPNYYIFIQNSYFMILLFFNIF